jgi:hypothetical protein
MHLVILSILLLPYASGFKFPQADGLINAFKNAVDCDSCHALLAPLKGLADLGDTLFVETLTTTCKVLKVRSPVLIITSLAETLGSSKTKTSASGP